jgi:hypothetical protein
MSVIQNKWIEKQRKKKGAETAPAFEQAAYDILDSTGKPLKRFTNASGATMIRTLRGVRR